jgi:hypothetical protein
LPGELKGLEIGTLHSERSEDSGEEELVYLPNRPEDDPLFRYLHAEMRERLTSLASWNPGSRRFTLRPSCTFAPGLPITAQEETAETNQRAILFAPKPTTTEGVD